MLQHFFYYIRSEIYNLYLEVTDYQLFVVNTVEKWIGFYL